MTDLDRMLDTLEEEIRAGKKTMFAAANFKLVDEYKCLEYINQIRNMLPSALSEARVVMQDRNDILERAKSAADEIVSSAKDDAQKLVSENSIVAEAQKRANDIYNEAVNYANTIVSDTYKFLAGMTDEAYANLNKAMQAISDTRRNLDGKMRGERQ